MADLICRVCIFAGILPATHQIRMKPVGKI
jgi:hypothetical protein